MSKPITLHCRARFQNRRWKICNSSFTRRVPLQGHPVGTLLPKRAQTAMACTSRKVQTYLAVRSPLDDRGSQARVQLGCCVQCRPRRMPGFELDVPHLTKFLSCNCQKPAWLMAKLLATFCQKWPDYSQRTVRLGIPCLRQLPSYGLWPPGQPPLIPLQQCNMRLSFTLY